jgi:hypothetical protein
MVVIVAVAVLALVLVGGSILTSRGGLFGKRPAVSAGPQFKTGDPNVLAAKGDPLAQIATPPRQTRTEIKLTKDLGKPTFAVEFQPYGLATNGTAVIRIDKATAQGGSKLAPQFAQTLTGQNMLVSVALNSAGVLKAGGAYTGQLQLVQKGEVTTFAVTEVKRGQ